MAVFYSQSASKEIIKIKNKLLTVSCQSLDLSCRGVCKKDSGWWFVPGLLPSEEAHVDIQTFKKGIGTATLKRVLTSSPLRKESGCALASRCGGCSIAYMPSEMALNAKITGIQRLFCKSLKLQFTEPYFIVNSPETGYRRVCRLATRRDHGKVVVGFRNAFSQDIVPVEKCVVLTERLNDVVSPLTKCINQLAQIKKTVGHIELVDSAGAVGVYIRLTEVLNPEEESRLKTFAHDQKTKLVIYVAEPYRNIMGDEELRERCISENSEELYLYLDKYKVTFSPSAFIQINEAVNTQMVQKVLEAVQPKAGSTVLDLFCGLGNFSFPLAANGATVRGVDIVSSMVKAGNDNAASHGLTNLSFSVANLEEDFEKQLWAKDVYDAVVLDPGRAGAKRVSAFLGKLRPPLIVMISCNPQAAARDVTELVKAGYRVENWGVFDMFPRTTHVEMLLVLRKESSKK